jgi:hypothetical protein
MPNYCWIFFRWIIVDIRYLLGCGYKWNAAEEEKEDPSASGGLPGAS